MPRPIARLRCQPRACTARRPRGNLWFPRSRSARAEYQEDWADWERRHIGGRERARRIPRRKVGQGAHTTGAYICRSGPRRRHRGLTRRQTACGGPAADASALSRDMPRPIARPRGQPRACTARRADGVACFVSAVASARGGDRRPGDLVAQTFFVRTLTAKSSGLYIRHLLRALRRRSDHFSGTPV